MTNNIVKFPSKQYKHKPKNFYKWVMPARIVAVTIAVSVALGIMTAIFGPATFIALAVLFMIWTMVYLP